MNEIATLPEEQRPVRSMEEDDAWQRRVRDRLLSPWYQQKASWHWFADREKGAVAVGLQDRGIDTLAIFKHRLVSIDEKMARPPLYTKRPFPDYYLELKSRTVPTETPGWMEYGRAEVVLYCFAYGDQDEPDRLDCRMLDAVRLKAWVAANRERCEAYAMTRYDHCPTGVKAPIGAVDAAALICQFWVEA